MPVKKVEKKAKKATTKAKKAIKVTKVAKATKATKVAKTTKTTKAIKTTKTTKATKVAKPTKAPKATRTTKTRKEKEQKLRIKVFAYEHKLLDNSVSEIISAAERHDATICGPVPMPTKLKKWTVNRSSFVHKDAREQFEMRVHSRLIDIKNPNPKIVEALVNLSLPSGVKVDVQMS